jgi:hypothetical protein
VRRRHFAEVGHARVALAALDCEDLRGEARPQRAMTSSRPGRRASPRPTLYRSMPRRPSLGDRNAFKDFTDKKASLRRCQVLGDGIRVNAGETLSENRKAFCPQLRSGTASFFHGLRRLAWGASKSVTPRQTEHGVTLPSKQKHNSNCSRSCGRRDGARRQAARLFIAGPFGLNPEGSFKNCKRGHELYCEAKRRVAGALGLKMAMLLARYCRRTKVQVVTSR